jgi:ABC-type phosphonate transport system ATPase subunit
MQCVHMQVGAAMGAGIATAMVSQKLLPGSVLSVVGGAAVGTVAGLVAHGVTCPKLEKTEKRSLKDFVKQARDSVDKMG